MSSFYVKALWDGAARVFYSETDIPGLTVEAATLADFEQLAFALAPEMLADNLDIHGDVAIRFSAERDVVLAVA